MENKKQLLDDIQGFKSLEANWDGEGALKPSASSISDAEEFIRMFDCKESMLPNVMLLATGEVSLYWKKPDLYIEFVFLGNGRVPFFTEKKGEKHKGETTMQFMKLIAFLNNL